MRAAYYEKNGAARDVLRVGAVDTPTPGPGEVRVKLRTSGVNPSDVKAREGRTRKLAYPRVIPHSDGAGEIDMVGDGVPAARKGERVWVWNGQWKRPFGTCAEYIVVPAALASALPATASYEAGADYTIDYKRENVGERIMAATGKTGVDAVVEMDLAANAKLYPGLLRPRGHVVVYGTGSAEATIPAQPALVAAMKIEFVYVYELTAPEREAAVSAINRMLGSNALVNNVALSLPLSDIVAAHEAVEQGQTMGNIVITL